MKKIVLGLLTIVALSGASQTAQAGIGAACGEVLGGFGLGLVLANANRPRRQVVYVDSPQKGSYDRRVRHNRHGSYVKDEYGNKIYLDR